MAQSYEKDIRTQMLEALTRYNIKQVDVAKEAGIHHSTLSLWLQGKVKGHHIKIEDTLKQWLDSLYSGRPRYTTLNKILDKQYVLTPGAMTIQRKKPYDGPEHLIPVYFDIELEGKKYKEQFCWNINEPYFTPEQFAHLLVTENSQYNNFQSQITESIKRAITAYRQTKLQTGPCIKVLEIDVKVDNICVQDRFEWDINDDSNCPQDFAASIGYQINLPDEFVVKIAHQIREQIQYYRKKDLNRTGSEGLMDLKKATRNLINLSGKENSLVVEISPSNYLRHLPNDFWEPRVEVLNEGEIRKGRIAIPVEPGDLSDYIMKALQTTYKKLFDEGLLKPYVATAIKLLVSVLKETKPQNILVSFNGGKDATVSISLYLLALGETYGQIATPPTCIYFQQPDPFPELEQFMLDTVHKYNLKLVSLPSKKYASELTQLSKKDPYTHVIMGNRRTDPYCANLNPISSSDVDKGYPSFLRVFPILDWTSEQVWAFSRDHQVQHCSLYGKGYSSLGNRSNTSQNERLLINNAYLHPENLPDELERINRTASNSN